MKHGGTRTEAPLEAPLSAAAFRDITGVSAQTLERLEVLVALLRKWQRRINLVATASLADVWRRHVLDSAQLHPLLPDRARLILDLGSGAGFPGLVLAIMGAGEVHLVDSDGRKCAFLEEANRATEAGAIIHRRRIEKLPPFAAEVVTARALAPLTRLIEYAQPFLGARSLCLFLKGREAERELTDSEKTWIIKVTRIDSLSSPSATILKLEDISHRHGR